MHDSWKIVDRVKEGVAILRMEVPVMKSVFDRVNSFSWGIFSLVLPIVVNSFLAALSFPSGFGSIFSKFVFWPISVPFLAMGASFVVMALFVERNLKIKLEWKKFFGLLGSASVVCWLTSLVFLFNAIGLMDISSLFNLIWLGSVALVFFAAYTFLMKVKGLVHKDALISVIVGVVSLFLIQILLGKMLVGSYYRLFY